MEVKETIRNFILESTDNKDIRDDESLYDLGILDSLKIIQMVAWLQSRFGIVIDPSDMEVEDFETIDNITSFIKSKWKGNE